MKHFNKILIVLIIFVSGCLSEPRSTEELYELSRKGVIKKESTIITGVYLSHGKHQYIYVTTDSGHIFYVNNNRIDKYNSGDKIDYFLDKNNKLIGKYLE